MFPAATLRLQPYRIFGKKTHKRSMTFVDELGTLEAISPQAALDAAKAEYGDELLGGGLFQQRALLSAVRKMLKRWRAGSRRP